MNYIVVGFMAADMPRLMRLGLEIRKHTASLTNRRRSRDVVMLGVGSVLEARDFDLLSARFKRDFDTFALLNEVAIEACNAVGFSITNLGVIDESELSVRPHVLLTCPFWD